MLLLLLLLLQGARDGCPASYWGTGGVQGCTAAGCGARARACDSSQLLRCETARGFHLVVWCCCLAPTDRYALYKARMRALLLH
jgi:hypothetical protein